MTPFMLLMGIGLGGFGGLTGFLGAGRCLGREAGFSAAAAKCAASGRNDEFWGVRKNRQQQRQKRMQVLRLRLRFRSG